MWKYGLLFYEIAFPVMITSNILYFSNFSVIFTNIRNLLKNKPWIQWLVINNQPIRDDIKENLMVSYYKKNDD